MKGLPQAKSKLTSNIPTSRTSCVVAVSNIGFHGCFFLQATFYYSQQTIENEDHANTFKGATHFWIAGIIFFN